MSEHDLQVFTRLIKERLVGKKVLDVHYALRTDIPQIVQRYFKTTGDVLELFESVFADLFTEHLTSSGREYVFDFATDNLSELYKILSDDARMAQEIRELTSTDEMRSVVIDNMSYFANLTLISQKFVIPVSWFRNADSHWSCRTRLSKNLEYTGLTCKSLKYETHGLLSLP